ncbi:MAG TPA: YciI family protein [Alphaproteobacteria bacterium]
MRFMILRKADKVTEGGRPPEELLAAMAKYAEEMAQAGVLLAGSGLQPTSKGARIRFAGGKPTVMDGPFTESKELLAGYFLIEVRSKPEAIDWARRWPPVDANVELEVREVVEAADCVVSRAIEREIERRKELAATK